MKKTLGYLLLEALLIGLSVITAFWLENYRESRGNEKTKVEFYKRIRSDLVNDSTEWAKLEISIKIQKERISDLLQELTEPTKELTGIAVMLFRLEREIPFYDLYSFLDKGFTFNSIISGNQINIFENDSTFLEIQEYYSYKTLLLKELKSYETYCEGSITPYMDKYFDRQALRYNPEVRFQIDVIKTPTFKTADFQTREFMNYVKNSENYLLPGRYVESSKRFSKEMIKVIDKRLKKN